MLCAEQMADHQEHDINANSDDVNANSDDVNASSEEVEGKEEEEEGSRVKFFVWIGFKGHPGRPFDPGFEPATFQSQVQRCTDWATGVPQFDIS